MPHNLSDYTLPKHLYRRFLLMTETWPGTRANPGSLMVKCHKGGNGIPFFWCGWPLDLPSFYGAIGKERPIYCICGTYSVVEPTEENIHALATYYADEILKVQAQGPFLLGGFCEAALLAYEIAKKLNEQDHQIGELFLVECDVTESDTCINVVRRCFDMLERLFAFYQSPMRTLQEFLLNKYKKLIGLYGKLKTKPLQTSVTPPNYYQLTPYPGNVTLIFVKWGELGYFQFGFIQDYWKKLVLGNPVFYIIDGHLHNDAKNLISISEILRIRLLEAGY